MVQQTLPRETYFDPAWFARESRSIFYKGIHFAAFASDLKDAGDYTAITVCGYPVVVLRDQDGTLRAFLNLRRHRGTELLEGAGNCGKTIVFPYHRWTYMLDGRLRGVPNRDLLNEINRDRLGFKPASVGQWKRMIFVSPDPRADFAQWIAPLDGASFPHDIEAGDLVCGEEFVYRINFNWKVFFEKRN